MAHCETILTRPKSHNHHYSPLGVNQIYFPDSVDSYSVGDFYSFRSSFLKKYSIVSKWEPEHNHQKPNQLQLGSDFRAVHYKTTL